jgi:hypothetical protein
MRTRFSLLGLPRQFRTDIQTVTSSRFRGGPSIGDRAVALDRIAGSSLLACVAAAGFWLVGQTLPLSQLPLPNVAESAQAATPASNLDLQRLGEAAAAEPLTTADVRQVQSRLQMMGFKPGMTDGIAGGRTIDALNRYRKTKDLGWVPELDRATAVDLLN